MADFISYNFDSFLMLIGLTADMLILRFSKLPLESGFSFARHALDKTCELNPRHLIISCILCPCQLSFILVSLVGKHKIHFQRKKKILAFLSPRTKPVFRQLSVDTFKTEPKLQWCIISINIGIL